MRTDDKIRSDLALVQRGSLDPAIQGYWVACERLANDVPELLGRALRAETALAEISGVEMHAVRAALRVALNYADGTLAHVDVQDRAEELAGCWTVLQRLTTALGDAVPTPTTTQAASCGHDFHLSAIDGTVWGQRTYPSGSAWSTCPGPVPAPTQPAETPEPCGAKQDNCPCRLSAGHERDHACAHGYWIG